jgi:hypothetical protein
MKKLIFSIAALAAIVVMGSCSQDSSLNNQTEKSVGNVTVSLNVNSGIEVSENNSSMDKSTVNSTRALTTRAGGTTTTPAPFTVDLSKYEYTAYFVAAQDAGDYKTGDLVRKVTVTGGNNSISVPAIKYNIYVTNYDPATAITTGSQKESAVTGLEKQLPESSTSTLYLFGSQLGADFSNTTDATQNKATVNLTNHYAAVCIAANDFVKSVSYEPTPNDPHTYVTYATSQNWFYMYINTSVTTMPNSIIALQNFSGTIPPDYDLNTKFDKTNPLVADNVYMFTVNDDYTGGGQGGATLTVSTDVFKQTKSSNLSVY